MATVPENSQRHLQQLNLLPAKLADRQYLGPQNQPQGTQYLTSVLREYYSTEIIAPSKHMQEKGCFPSKADSKYYPECS